MNDITAGYPEGQLAKAFTTALSHEDAATRRRADKRVKSWRRVLEGMGSGKLAIGSRRPVRRFPIWVTLEVVKGGFATGVAKSEGPLQPHEAAIAPDRARVFAHYLTDAGLAELQARLDSGQYSVNVPEEAALLTVAWLIRAGDRAAALDVLETIRPYADRLRFAPVPGTADVDPSIVSRRTVGEVRESLQTVPRNLRVETQREALTIWNPFADELLTHWLTTCVDGQVAATEPPGWRKRGQELLDRYAVLAAEHPLCTKHQRPKENQAILRLALEDALAKGLKARRRGLLQHAVDSMLTRRGTPGTPEFEACRSSQHTEASRPLHHELATTLATQLASLDQSIGWTAGEVGDRVPEGLWRKVMLGRRGTVGELIELGVVPSAEVLAELVPQLTGVTTALAYQDEPLRRLMAATYRAFQRRRSVLLFDLQRQVRMDELPWVRAVKRVQTPSDTSRAAARTMLKELSGTAISGFPATILPNPLVEQFRSLVKSAGIVLPLTEELAADIFEGKFSPKYAESADLVAALLQDTPYERYYALDYAGWLGLPHPAQRQDAFVQQAYAAAGEKPARSVAGNGKIIEQAQILTTHNLAALVIALDLELDWPDLSRRAFAGVIAKLKAVEKNPRPLRTIKDAAYAWRQLMFFLSLCAPQERLDFLGWTWTVDKPASVSRRLDPVLADLHQVLLGQPAARRFLGWTTNRHWMLYP
ncbi:hypothetical protein [Streptomyces sp. SID13031]|uniref:hypothetical protein n=1 Tax=Streptomyces sp. SID13031 TaxID=2706046 RepID=UPI0013C6AFCA|nr:hypothetical protein [Streptomyces sp. SID13031]NEA30414.1 hypothetical protein [Streptomyces sp. SID13031]